MNIKYFIITVICSCFVLVNCADNLSNLGEVTPQERFEIGKEHFYSGDYSGAKYVFQSLSRVNIIAAYSDSAQYLLAESHYNLREFILAESEFSRLVRSHPGSQLVKNARIMSAECFSEMSLSANLAQEYTHRAIAEYTRFLQDYPMDEEYGKKARSEIVELRSKLAKKDYDSAILYMKQRDFRSAITYFEFIVEGYPDTEYLAKSWFNKAECYYILREHPIDGPLFLENAIETYTFFTQLFPDHEYVAKALDKLKSLKK